jgi:hypothetical protein
MKMSASGYVEPEAKMNNEGLMSKIRSFKYDEGVLARSASSGHCDGSFQLG